MLWAILLERSELLRGGIGLIAGLPFGVGHAVNDLARGASCRASGHAPRPRPGTSSRDNCAEAARFIRSMFCTSVRPAGARPAARNAAASSSVRVVSSISANIAYLQSGHPIVRSRRRIVTRPS